jgi:iron complex outermembrane receptor protein
MSRYTLLRHASALALAIGGLSLSQARAQDATSSVTVTAARQPASAVAPSLTPADAVQPTSVLGQTYIQNDIAGTANYDDVVKITPSVNSVGPNGPGLMEGQSLTIRGFQDGQYNVTIDGIAWGDSNDFTHHTTSYVMSHDYGAVSVDRGPGTASTLGDATFGGTVAMTTKDPLAKATAEAYGSVGSFGTYLEGGELDSGSIASLNGARGMFDIEHLSSDGALSNMGQDRTNLFTKVVIPVSDRTTITAAAMYNQLHQYVSLGATEAQYQTLGYSYGLNSNPASQAYYGYNYDRISTNLIYVDVKSDLGAGFLIDNKVYTYSYYHEGHNGYDPNGETPNGTYYGANNVPGQTLNNDYSSYGDMARLSKDFGLVLAKAGFWYDHQVNNRNLFDTDYTNGLTDIAQPNSGGYPPTVGVVGNVGVPGIEKQQVNTLDTFQPYVEADIKPLPGLIITPGVKYASFDRSIAAPVNQGTYQPLYYSHTFDAVLPSLAIHYEVTPSITTYAQAAEGFLAPNLNTYYTTNPSLSTTLQPEKTWNYQTGVGYHSDRLTVSGDLYYIDFSNEIGSRIVGGAAIFYNEGGTIYEGVETEGTFRLVGNFSLYANGSINSAKDKTTHLTIANSPDSTAAAGLMYNANGLHADLMAKYVGQRYGDNPELYKLPGYTTAQLSIGYTFQPAPDRPMIRISGLVDNLFDYRGESALAGYTVAAGTPLFWNVVPRNYELKLSASF